jgi:hypothetical protein
VPHVYSRIPRETILEVRRRFAAGEPPKSIAPALGICVDTVNEHVADLPQEGATREARRRAVLASLEAGLDVRATAAKVGCSIGRVVRILRSARAAAEVTT